MHPPVLLFYVRLAVSGAKNRLARAVLNSRVQLCLLAGGVPCGKLVSRQEHQRGKKKMTVWKFTVLVWIGSAVAGLLGSLTGLGGGVVLVPLLTLFFKVDIRYAIGASLVSVIATSSGAAAAYVKEGFSNIRIGMFLEIATTLGALSGAFLAVWVPTKAIAIIFGVVLLISAFLSRKPRTPAERNAPPDPLATRLRLNGTFPDLEGTRSYNVQRVPAGFGIMFGAGALSGLLGL